VSCAETERLIREALAENFPTQDFAIRSKVFSDGASIDVRWLDGPASQEVESVVRQFEAAHFDEQTGQKMYNSGVHPETGERVQFGADFIFAHRVFTLKFLSSVVKQVSEELGRTTPQVRSSSSGAYVVDDPDQPTRVMAREIIDLARSTSAYIKPGTEMSPRLSPNSKHVRAEPLNGDGGAGGSVFVLRLESGGELHFGLDEARAIIANINDILDFVREAEEEQADA
jgi:hypothetical protein